MCQLFDTSLDTLSHLFTACLAYGEGAYTQGSVKENELHCVEPNSFLRRHIVNKLVRILIPLLFVFAFLITTYALAAQIYQERQAALFTTPTPISIRLSGPEADPYLRHIPGSYDYENALPPSELPFQ